MIPQKINPRWSKDGQHKMINGTGIKYANIEIPMGILYTEKSVLVANGKMKPTKAMDKDIHRLLV